eukprot:7005075-Lingulodinium_polyedra.AAC.1
MGTLAIRAVPARVLARPRTRARVQCNQTQCNGHADESNAVQCLFTFMAMQMNTYNAVCSPLCVAIKMNSCT